MPTLQRSHHITNDDERSPANDRESGSTDDHQLVESARMLLRVDAAALLSSPSRPLVVAVSGCTEEQALELAAGTGPAPDGSLPLERPLESGVVVAVALPPNRRLLLLYRNRKRLSAARLRALDCFRALLSAGTRQPSEPGSLRLHAIVENLPQAAVVTDDQGRVTVCNRAAAQLWGHGPTPATLEDLPAAYHLHQPDGRPLGWTETPLARALLDGEPTTAHELLIRRPDGSSVPILSNCGPLRDGEGRILGAVEVFQDISAWKELDRLKDDFINTVSHELRTPTTTIRGGALTLLRRGDALDESTKRQLLRDMSDSAERLHILVEDMLSLSRSQAGMQIAPEPVIPHRFINQMILERGSRVGDHPLTVDVPANLPIIEADPFCLDQILRNLLENAVKFSPGGERIEIEAQAGDGEVIFSVLDRGSGIPVKDVGRVFEPFYRSDEVVQAGAQGAGLGLAVCERFARMQGGRIWAEPRPGGGTAFRFTLPAVADEAEADEA